MCLLYVTLLTRFVLVATHFPIWTFEGSVLRIHFLGSGLWILQTASVESCDGKLGRTKSLPVAFESQLGVVGRLTQRLHVWANNIANPADFGVAVDFVDAGFSLAKTIL